MESRSGGKAFESGVLVMLANWRLDGGLSLVGLGGGVERRIRISRPCKRHARLG